VATLGPATDQREAIRELLAAGVDVARINFSHGDHATHGRVIKTLREEAEKLDRPIAIMQDLCGPKIRTGELETDQIELQDGQELILTPEDVPGSIRKISINYENLADSVQPAGRILLDDGLLELSVKEIRGNEVVTVVEVGGILKANKGVNLPGADLDRKTLTEKDIRDLEFGLEHEVDLIALSFVRTAEDIEKLRGAIKEIDSGKADLPIIAKLEHPDAIENLHDIIHASDGVMVARGDLGIEMAPERVPIEQKRTITMANRHLSFVIIATQMLDSMIKKPRPSRAEASDVANAVLDGADAVMLSGETAVGRYPLKTVQMMEAIICQSESHMEEWGRTDFQMTEDFIQDDAVSITQAARELAHDRSVAAVAVFTQSGRTGKLMSKARPSVPILAFTPLKKTYQYLSMMWGINPYLISHAETVEEMLHLVNEAVLKDTPIQPGQEIVLIAGFPIAKMVPPNFALLHTIEEPAA